MFKKSLIFILALPVIITGFDLASKFFQNDYEIKDERYSLTWYNRSCFNYFTLINYKVNRTRKVINMTSNSVEDINFNDMIVAVQGYKFLSNEYRYFPLFFRLDLCTVLATNVLGFGTQNGNFGSCPILKNVHYYSYNWGPDHSKLPPKIPEGKYKFDSKGYYKKNLAFTLEYLVTVWPKIAMGDSY